MYIQMLPEFIMNRRRGVKIGPESEEVARKYRIITRFKKTFVRAK